jgi:hypothetical protein
MDVSVGKDAHVDQGQLGFISLRKSAIWFPKHQFSLRIQSSVRVLVDESHTR